MFCKQILEENRDEERRGAGKGCFRVCSQRARGTPAFHCLIECWGAVFTSARPERQNLAQTSEWDKGGVAWQFTNSIKQTWQHDFKTEYMPLGPGGTVVGGPSLWKRNTHSPCYIFSVLY